MSATFIPPPPGDGFVAGTSPARGFFGQRAGAIEALPFLAVAAAAHLAFFAIAPPGTSARGGGGGEAAVSIEAAAPALAAVIAEWETPPRAAAPIQATAPPEPADADTLPPDARAESMAAALPDFTPQPTPQPDRAPPAMAPPEPLPALPDMPATPAPPEDSPSSLPAPPPARSGSATPGLAKLSTKTEGAPSAVIDSTPPPPALALSGKLAPERSPQPVPRPERRAEPAEPPAQVQPTQPRAQTRAQPPQTRPQPSASPTPSASARAAGSGDRAQQGRQGRSETTSRAGADSTALTAQWGGQIRAAVQRQQRHPARGRMSGTVQLRLEVHSNGRLASVRVIQSSGHAALDRAAIEAAQRARMPGAPRGLNAGTYRFNLPVRFQG